VQTPEEFDSNPFTRIPQPVTASYNSRSIRLIDPDYPPWGFGTALLVWFVSLLLLIILPLAFLLPYAISHGITPSIPDYARVLTDFALKDPSAVFLQVLSTLPTHLLTFVLVWAVVTRFGKRPFWETLGWSWGRYFGLWSSIALGILLFLASSGLAHVLGGDKPTQLDLILNSSPASKYLIVFLATCTAPFAEEFVYRGLLYSALQRWIGKWGSVIVVLALFTLVHVPQYWPNRGVIAAVALLSIALTVVRAVSGRLLPCFVIHLVFNGIQSILIVAGHAGPKPEVAPQQVTSLILPLIRAFHSLI
jgi:uncharacterized protein